MKLRRRSGVAERPATVDLFAPASAGGTSVKPVTPVPPLTQRPVPPAAPRPRSAQLWYAVVFPELKESEAAAMLQRLGACALQFTSLVSIEMPNALLLEIKGSVKLFGSLTDLHARMDAAWSGLELRAQGAIAPTALAALWCARVGKRACIEEAGLLTGELAQLPLGCTAWDALRLETLHAMGVTRVGELLRLPRSGLARRLGPAAVLDLDMALARQAAPRRAFIPRERFRERCDFETEIETVVYLQMALEPLVERCARFLRERQAGIQALELRLRHRVKPMTRVRLGLASITGERRRLTDVLDGKLNRLELSAPVRGMELLSGSLRPLSAASVDAFAGGTSASEAVPHLVERLRARLGETAVYGVISVPEHRPEAAWQRVQELSFSVTGVRGLRVPAVSATGLQDDVPRPVWLLEAPLPLSSELQPTPHGGLILEQGPERIESGWWDGKDVARDYYIARRVHGASQGARWWVFQERRTKSWYLHGVFA
jgi:protein ImuB